MENNMENNKTSSSSSSSSAHSQHEMPPFDVNDMDSILKRWSRWSKRLDRLLDIKCIEDDNKKINYLFFYGGDCLEDIYSDMAENDDSYEDIMAKLCRFFRKCNKQHQHQQHHQQLDLDEKPASKRKPTKSKEDSGEVTFELVVDEENEKVTELIQKYNSTLEKMKELENEKKELDDMIKKTIGLKIRQVSTAIKSTSKLDHKDLEEKRKECIEMFCNNLNNNNNNNNNNNSSNKRANRYSHYYHRTQLNDYATRQDCLDLPRSADNVISRIPLPPLPIHLLNYKRPCLVSKVFRKKSTERQRYKFERLHVKKIID